MCLVVMEITAFGQSYEYILFNSLWENILYSASSGFSLSTMYLKKTSNENYLPEYY